MFITPSIRFSLQSLCPRRTGGIFFTRKATELYDMPLSRWAILHIACSAVYTASNFSCNLSVPSEKNFCKNNYRSPLYLWIRKKYWAPSVPIFSKNSPSIKEYGNTFLLKRNTSCSPSSKSSINWNVSNLKRLSSTKTLFSMVRYVIRPAKISRKTVWRFSLAMLMSLSLWSPARWWKSFGRTRRRTAWDLGNPQQASRKSEKDILAHCLPTLAKRSALWNSASPSGVWSLPCIEQDIGHTMNQIGKMRFRKCTM